MGGRSSGRASRTPAREARRRRRMSPSRRLHAACCGRASEVSRMWGRGEAQLTAARAGCHARSLEVRGRQTCGGVWRVALRQSARLRVRGSLPRCRHVGLAESYYIGGADRGGWDPEQLSARCRARSRDCGARPHPIAAHAASSPRWSRREARAPRSCRREPRKGSSPRGGVVDLSRAAEQGATLTVCVPALLPRELLAKYRT